MNTNENTVETPNLKDTLKSWFLKFNNIMQSKIKNDLDFDFSFKLEIWRKCARI